MGMDIKNSNGLMPLKFAAKKYRLPGGWLDREARAGRLPCLIADDSVFFDEAALLKALHRLARKGVDDGK